ncbi:MAG: hypothetical protein DI628_03665 [Blastochloris viridis]|uniref:Uncharacterized protein n=1 Tax=Blastochloris viridis TaxID=1079 RepID=A0A6N4RCK1_BLAVI|nr:MAG: hypothetical protein DI628_03665 [Blastochloris viridis]
MTHTQPQTIMVAAFCGTGAYRGHWIARMQADGKLSFLSTTRDVGETADEAAVRCVCEELWPDCPLGPHDFTLVGHNKRRNIKLFKLNWLLELPDLNMAGFALSSNRTPTASPLGMSILSRRAFTKASAFGRYMCPQPAMEQLHA